MRRKSRSEKKSRALQAQAATEEAELSPEVLAEMLAALRQSQRELTRTIDVLAGQIDSLQGRLSRAALPALPFGSTIPPRPVPSLFVSSSPALSGPLPRFEIRPQSLVAALMASPLAPPGFDVRSASPIFALPPPPPPGFEMRPPSPIFALPPPPPPSGFEMAPPSPVVGFPAPPPVPIEGSESAPTLADLLSAAEAGPSLTPLDTLLGEEFGRSPTTPSAAPLPAPPVVPAVPEENNATVRGADGSPTPAGDFAVRPTLDNPGDDSQASTSAPAPDFFRSSSQSFASAAAMVNDILAAAPDAVPEPGRTEPAGGGPKAVEEPAAPEIPITPDFFTARPRKRFGLRR